MTAGGNLLSALRARAKAMFHTCDLKQRENWGIVNGNLVCLRTTYCQSCDHKRQDMLLIATPEQLAEAQSKVVQYPGNSKTPEQQ